MRKFSLLLLCASRRLHRSLSYILNKLLQQRKKIRLTLAHTFFCTSFEPESVEAKRQGIHARRRAVRRRFMRPEASLYKLNLHSLSTLGCARPSVGRPHRCCWSKAERIKKGKETVGLASNKQAAATAAVLAPPPSGPGATVRASWLVVDGLRGPFTLLAL